MFADYDSHRATSSDSSSMHVTAQYDDCQPQVTRSSPRESYEMLDWFEEPGAAQPLAALNALLGFVVMAGLLAASIALGLVR